MKEVLNKIIDGIEEGAAILDHIGMPEELYAEVSGKKFEAETGEYRGFSAFDNPNLLFGIRTVKGHIVVMVYDKEWGKCRTMVERFQNDPNPQYIAVLPEDVGVFLSAVHETK